MPSIAFVSALPLGQSVTRPPRARLLNAPCAAPRPVARPPVATAQHSEHSFEDFESALNELALSKTQTPKPAKPLRIPSLEPDERKPRRRSIKSPVQEDDVWTDEQHALYSVLMDNHYLASDESLRARVAAPGAPDPSDSAFLTAEPSPTTVAASRSLQSNPRLSDAEELRTRLSAIRRRRTKIAAERAEDVKHPFLTKFESDRRDESEADAQSEEEEWVGGKNGDPFDKFVEDLIRSRASSAISESLRSAVIPPASVMRDPPSQLVASLDAHIQFTSPAPMLRRPILEAHGAVMDAIYPPCVRCTAPTWEDKTEQYGLCDGCYTSIHLGNPFGRRHDALPDMDPFRRKELLAHEAAQTAKATAVAATVRSPFAAATAATATSTVNASAQPPSDSATEQKPTAPRRAEANMSKTARGNGGPVSTPPQPPGSVQDQLSDDGWNVRAADRALRTINPIRNLVQGITVKPTPDKELIKLSVGDPTVYGNLVVSQRVTERMCALLRGGGVNGYTLSMGCVEGREAVARRYSLDHATLSKDDVFLTSGASGALELALGVLANEGDNILLPKPGFPLFRTLAENLGIECRYYRLSAEQEWQADLGDLTALCDERTRAIVVNNPSNPCGSVWSREHMEQLLAVASELRLPILSDEVYADMTFGGTPFHSFGSVSEDVPVLAVGAISKQLVVPGWRLGWLLVHDRGDVLARGGVRQGLRQLTTRMLMPNSIAQMGLDEMLQDSEGFTGVMRELEANARFTMESLKDVDGLKCIAPQGAMYLMVEVDVGGMGLRDDMEFVERLLEEEAVFVLPGQCFEMANYVRIVFAAPKEILSEAMLRIASFCRRQMRR